MHNIYRLLFKNITDNVICVLLRKLVYVKDSDLMAWFAEFMFCDPGDGTSIKVLSKGQHKPRIEPTAPVYDLMTLLLCSGCVKYK